VAQQVFSNSEINYSFLRTMPYNKSSGCIEGAIGWGLIGYLAYHFFGWVGLAIGTAGFFLILSVIVVINGQYIKYRDRKFRNAPCFHGVAGAGYDFKKCRQCEQERIAEERAAKRKAAEEEAKKKAAKEQAYKEWVAKIRLPDYLLKMHPKEFEHLVCALFQRMGYEVEHTPYIGDRGIDGYLKKDGELSVLQCKRVKGSVGEPVLRDLFGTMHAAGAKEGVVVTTGKVSTQARDWSQDKPIKIYELDELTACIRKHFKEDDVVPTTFIPNRGIEDICPRCGNPMKVVRWRGKSFMGCSAYPSCRYTKDMPRRRERGQ
jgi:ssDNA-binding Zn-finger/Zn-ribbon topoisomerase 1